MKRSTCMSLVLALFIAVVATLSFAQQTIKIGVVNSQEVLEKSSEGKKLIARLKEKDSSNQSKVAKLDDEIRQLETKINTQRLTLTNEAIIQMSSDLDRKRTEKKRVAEDAYREFEELRVRLFTKLQDELLPIIEQVGKEMNMDIIFDLAKSGTIYFNPSIDVTAEIINRYDASKASKQ